MRQTEAQNVKVGDYLYHSLDRRTYEVLEILSEPDYPPLGRPETAPWFRVSGGPEFDSTCSCGPGSVENHLYLELP